MNFSPYWCDNILVIASSLLVHCSVRTEGPLPQIHCISKQ